ncbi:Hybrid signal transduction histidine kinase B [Hypsizygus marmoreus]|uniref:histidine kinase n=1 Tax=Hypsizygus marmoreus TaxID=39966 RepID=A0A369JZZ0_HYPMA|nr:Hybrid signal transduction histidine kinase B [Hypsizygus marmoreus]
MTADGEGLLSSLPEPNPEDMLLENPTAASQAFSTPRIATFGTLKRPPHKSTRPSTAPAREETPLLPSSLPFQVIAAEEVSGHLSDLKGITHMQTVAEDETDVTPNLTLGTLPSPFEANSSEYISASHVDVPSATNKSDNDWETFISAYASGRWDPRRTPSAPRSHVTVSTHAGLSLMTEPPASSPIASNSLESGSYHGSYHMNIKPGDSMQSQADPQDIRLHPKDGNNHTPATLDASAGALPSKSPATSSSSLSFRRFRPTAPINLPIPAHRMRSSFSTSSTPLPAAGETLPSSSAVSHSNTEVQTTVATLRWAAARVDISPLALPSPEHELTDPMRGVTAVVPGSRLPDINHSATDPLTPGGTRKLRLTSFWHGTTDVETDAAPGVPSRLTTLVNVSPESSQDTSPVPVSVVPEHVRSHSKIEASIPPATAPAGAHASDEMLSDDYFGASAVGAHGNTNPPRTQEVATVPVVDHVTSPEMGTMSVPALPRRVCLTRQTSSPLPIASSRDPRFAGRVATESVTSMKSGRAAKEEQMFAELGYLAPPNPPDELERRRALYKFNIWNTGPDLNFDRIAHLAKLVFSTKGVMISLIDGNEQWFKSEWGVKTPSCARIHSFCAHSILQRGDEPMVILDTHSDWRFAKNPLVTGHPHLRFYAGAPLRTSDGFNIGTLAVIDDSARDDFSPRQRHTLKEFAAIAMREMELWRDKIQLRIRDRIQNSMEQFSRECLEIHTERHMEKNDDRLDQVVESSMDKVYDRAAKLVKRTLDVEGVIVMDISHCEVLESMSAEGSVSVIMHYGDPQMGATQRQLSSEEYHKLDAFFAKHPDGKISEGIVPQSFRPFLPTHIQYALTVPIYNIDKRPFALLCAYNVSDHTKRYLEGHELSYLRAIGVIILSAVLKRRMILADKAKSLFISNISHELRTPLHGILAAAELLSDSHLNHSQLSFLQTVQACGNSLVETVNHVLDFTKLSGNSKAGGVENVIVPSKVDLMQLVEEAVDGCWIGHRARAVIMEDSGIGSVYSPPREDQSLNTVETVIDIGYRSEGWTIKCEKGGIRRVLMNVFGNSLKFTTDGYVHVVLRELPHSDGDPPNKIKIELAVLDTGKGISQNFLKNQLFHPFSQENPLQTGTGLGLAIVNSIVTSESVGGKVEVWSEEGLGTEIKVTFYAEKLDEDDGASTEMGPFKMDDMLTRPTVSLVGFDTPHKGVMLLRKVLQNYLTSWWGFEVQSGPKYGDILILNEDPSLVQEATERHDTSRPFIVFSASRGSPKLMAIATDHERIGGFCRILFKPGGPSRLRAVLNLSIHALKIGSRSRQPSPMNNDEQLFLPLTHTTIAGAISRRNSDYEENHNRLRQHYHRPPMSLRSSTAHPTSTSWQLLTPTNESSETPEIDMISPTISIGQGGSLLKSAVRTFDAPKRRFRVLVVEDNSILRSLLTKWLSQKGYDHREAADGRDGVTVYETDGPFDVVLLDLSMPVLDGIAATGEIRKIEAVRVKSEDPSDGSLCPTRILVLTGMSSLEDKRRAFEAGVDGYLVKPVAFKTLDEMFHKLGIA